MVLALFGFSGNQAVDPIAQAANVSANAIGYEMNMSFTVTSPQLEAPISASANAEVDATAHAASMALSLHVPQGDGSPGTATAEMAVVLDDQNVYVRFPPAVTNQLPGLGGKPWIEINVAKAAGLPALSALGEDPTTTDPSEMLQELRAGADGVTDEGQQRVDGVQTTHYRGMINLEQLLPNLPSAEQASLRKLIQGQGVPVDVWSDAHHLVRRIDMFLALGVGNGPSLQESVTADFSHYGPQPPPTLPPASLVTNASGLLAGQSS